MLEGKEWDLLLDQPKQTALRDRVGARNKLDRARYMAPFQYVYMNGILYFRFTDYSRKMKLLEKDKRVCVEIEKCLPDMSDYSFVVLRGKLNVVTDPEERAEVIRRMLMKGKRNFQQTSLPLTVSRQKKAGLHLLLRSP